MLVLNCVVAATRLLCNSLECPFSDLQVTGFSFLTGEINTNVLYVCTEIIHSN